MKKKVAKCTDCCKTARNANNINRRRRKKTPTSAGTPTHNPIYTLADASNDSPNAIARDWRRVRLATQALVQEVESTSCRQHVQGWLRTSSASITREGQQFLLSDLFGRRPTDGENPGLEWPEWYSELLDLLQTFPDLTWQQPCCGVYEAIPIDEPSKYPSLLCILLSEHLSGITVDFVHSYCGICPYLSNVLNPAPSTLCSTIFYLPIHLACNNHGEEIVKALAALSPDSITRSDGFQDSYYHCQPFNVALHRWDILFSEGTMKSLLDPCPEALLCGDAFCTAMDRGYSTELVDYMADVFRKNKFKNLELDSWNDLEDNFDLEHTRVLTGMFPGLERIKVSALLGSFTVQCFMEAIQVNVSILDLNLRVLPSLAETEEADKENLLGSLEDALAENSSLQKVTLQAALWEDTNGLLAYLQAINRGLESNTSIELCLDTDEGFGFDSQMSTLPYKRSGALIPQKWYHLIRPPTATQQRLQELQYFSSPTTNFNMQDILQEVIPSLPELVSVELNVCAGDETWPSESFLTDSILDLLANANLLERLRIEIEVEQSDLRVELDLPRILEVLKADNQQLRSFSSETTSLDGIRKHALTQADMEDWLEMLQEGTNLTLIECSLEKWEPLYDLDLNRLGRFRAREVQEKEQIVDLLHAASNDFVLERRLQNNVMMLERELSNDIACRRAQNVIEEAKLEIKEAKDGLEHDLMAAKAGMVYGLLQASFFSDCQWWQIS